MSETKTDQTFEAGDRVYDEDLGYGTVVKHGPIHTLVELDEAAGPSKLWHVEHADLELVVCEYCGSRKGCTCQEDIDSAEEFRKTWPENPR